MVIVRRRVLKPQTVTKGIRNLDIAGVPIPKKKKKAQVAPSPRKSITPGTILILLGGRYRGKRVVYLKQLPSGLLLVTGPYKVNGVPLRRVNQAYVIATSTNVDVSGVQVPDSVNDAYFQRDKSKPRLSREEEFFTDGKPKEKEPLSADRVSNQKSIDAAVIAQVKKIDHMTSYLSTPWGLSKGQYPHAMKF